MTDVILPPPLAPRPSPLIQGGKPMSKRKVLIPLDGSEFSRQIAA